MKERKGPTQFLKELADFLENFDERSDVVVHPNISFKF
jgi:hypothetical protein